ncbi:hypothetical protein BYT27DRAFT_7192709 [Phlegmacium glaucopus]|nr:hypothetical protein BYT27DRAFT_7192709 [Phlegmacium glaucopus]
MDTSTLKPTIQNILEDCPRSRVLVVGKSGVGKSSLIQYAFNVDIASVSHKEAGVCDINEEIISKHNSYFVLHDSQGFEHNEIDNLEKVKNFIQSRSGEAIPLKDRVHAIWLCIQIPFAGGRVFETGDEKFLEFLKLETQLPIVIVFTQFDVLVSRMEENLSEAEIDLSEKEMDQLCLQRADAEFKRLCLEPLRKLAPRLKYAKISVKPPYQQTLAHLINLTQGLVAQSSGDLWIVFATAQRVSAQLKIKSSIEVGMKQYWQSLASSSNLVGWSLKDCLSTLHDDITSSWNFYDPENLLSGEDFRNKIMTLVQLVTADSEQLQSWFQNPEKLQALIGIAIIVVAGAAPAIAMIGLSLAFLKWITGVYKKTPETLRCLMGYIVGVTLIMERLFLNTLHLTRPFSLTQDHIDAAIEDYKDSEAIKVHRAIRQYANKTTFLEILKSNIAEKKVIELIQEYQQTPV